ncbi:MAG TPA: GNAT family N-acetyltransferase [Rhodothermales bacterium]|nr:GNAT family N-acetyltransferase [Rhodothermales bacterium]
MSFSLRRATPEDADVLCDLILGLADYEKLLHEAKPDLAALRQHLAEDANPRCEALLANDEFTGDAVGFALFFPNYSTFLTRWGIYLEDLYVKPTFRGHGIGFALLQRVAQIAVARGAERLDWSVLDWNTPAIDFYHQLGAKAMDDWTGMRLTGDALQRLGQPTA